MLAMRRIFVYTNSCKSGKAHMRIWRNWQTRTVQVRVNIVFVEVRILLSAPVKGICKKQMPFFRSHSMGGGVRGLEN